jgi:elongation factor G
LFNNALSPETIPEEFISGVERGVQSALSEGPSGECMVIDLSVTLIDWAYHPADSSMKAFEVAAHTATRAALQKTGTIMLEPVMCIEIVTPAEYEGSVVGDLKSRRGQIQQRFLRQAKFKLQSPP